MEKYKKDFKRAMKDWDKDFLSEFRSQIVEKIMMMPTGKIPSVVVHTGQRWT